MDEQPQRLHTVFDAVAGSYDQVGVDFFQPIAEGLVRCLDSRPGERALDLGCGRGAALLPLARAVGPTGRAVGGDLAPNMVAAAQALAKDEGLTHVDVLVVDAQEPDLGHTGDMPFDLVAASLLLFFLPDPVSALRRWHDLLRPGGRVGVSTFGVQGTTWSEVDPVFDAYLPPQMLDARTNGQRGPFASDAGVEELLREAGFVDTHSVVEPLEVRFDDPEHWYRFSMSIGQRGFWMAVPEDRRSDVKAEAFQIMERHNGSAGPVTFTQDIRYTLGRRL